MKVFFDVTGGWGAEEEYWIHDVLTPGGEPAPLLHEEGLQTIRLENMAFEGDAEGVNIAFIGLIEGGTELP